MANRLLEFLRQQYGLTNLNGILSYHWISHLCTILGILILFNLCLILYARVHDIKLIYP